jgi:hypothetical protein
VLIAAFYVAMTFSGLASPTVTSWLWTLLVIAFYAQLGIWANAAALDYFTRRRTRQEMRDPSTVTGYGLLMFFVRVGIWITVAVSLLAYFRIPSPAWWAHSVSAAWPSPLRCRTSSVMSSARWPLSSTSRFASATSSRPARPWA